jgi:hypothetical protein
MIQGTLFALPSDAYGHACYIALRFSSGAAAVKALLQKERAEVR